MRDELAGGGSGSGSASETDGEDALSWAEIRHFVHAPLRRPWLVLGPWAAVLLLSAVALLVLPKKYMSSTLVLVESEKMPESFIAKVATRDPSQRLEAVRPEILSRTRLERVLEETQPYPEIDSKTQAVDKLRRSIFINLSGNDGFVIEFYHHDPHKAQQVTDRLARLFIEETMKSREQQVEGAVDFLVTQVNDARRQLEEKDAALRRYKEEHMGGLPEQLQTNLATMQMLQREMQTVEESLFLAREKQEALARGLERAASGERGTSAPTAAGELADLNRQLASMRTRYKEAHPDVQSLRSRIALLEQRLAEARGADGSGDPDASTAVTRGQLERATDEVKKLEERQRTLERRIAAYRNNVELTPRTEQELATLTRDYQKLNENYTALLSKQLEAQMSGRLEQRWKGEHFRMLDPASLPEKPVFPKPPLFLGLGAVLGLCLGLGAALLAELLDHTVKDSQGLQAVLGRPVLACIPHHPALHRKAGPRLVRLDGAPVRDDIPRREHDDHAMDESPAEVRFRELGKVGSPRATPVLEALRDHDSSVGEELRLLAAKLVELTRAHKASCLALTSALPVEGKTTISIGLTGALAREPRRKVLLIEADLRRPSLGPALGLPPGPGLSEWLSGSIEEVPIRQVEPGGFHVLAAGQAGLKRPEVLGSPRMEALLRAARARFDLVVLDAVPVLPVADTVLMQELVDGFLLVVRSRQTPRAAIHEALAKLRADLVLGVVLNDQREYRGSYKEYVYRRYGMAHRASPAAGNVARASVGLAAEPAARESTVPLAAPPITLVAPGRPEPAHAVLVARDPVAAPAAAAEAPARAARRRRPLLAAGLGVLVVGGVAGGYLAGRGRLGPASPPPVDPAAAAAQAAALERVKQLEERLAAIEAEKAAATAHAAEEARRQVEAQAAARGRKADPAVVARAQDDARRRAQAEQEQRLRDEQQRLEAEQRLIAERLAAQPARPAPEPAAEEAPATFAANVPPAPAPAAPAPTTASTASAPTASATLSSTPAATTPASGAPPVPGALASLADAGVIAPVLQIAPAPTYPPIAARQRLGGTVELSVLVDETGGVSDVRVVAGVGGRSGLNEAAVNSVKLRRYRPATRDGVAVRVWVPVRVQFRPPS
jgi:polysaccharide chain length determinant protein (PEP-CTERM system associated)